MRLFWFLITVICLFPKCHHYCHFLVNEVISWLQREKGDKTVLTRFQVEKIKIFWVSLWKGGKCRNDVLLVKKDSDHLFTFCSAFAEQHHFCTRGKYFDTVFENQRKKSHLILWVKVYILSGQKFIKSAKNSQFRGVFENLKFEVKQVTFIWTKIGEKCQKLKKSNANF